MSELTLTILQLGFVVLLWVFVLSVVGVLRRDLFGTRAAAKAPPRGAGQRPRPAPPTPARPEPAPAPPADRAPASLVVTEGALRGTALTLGTAPVLIGRNPECTLVLDDDYASGRHARLFPQDGRWYVEDLGSTNGTRLGRAAVTRPTPVDVGQELRIGRTVLELRR